MKKSPQIHEILSLCLQILESSDEETLESVLQRYPEYADQLRPALETAIWLREHRSEFNPRPGFVSASRHRLVARLDQNAAPSRSKAPGFIFLQFRQVLLALSLVTVLVFGFNGVAQASQPALPGDVLYPVKLSVEQFRLALSPIETDAELSVQFTERRFEELLALVQTGRQEDVPLAVTYLQRQVQDTLVRIDQLAILNRLEGERIANTLQDVFLAQSTIMESLLETTPLETRMHLQEVIELSKRGTQSVRKQFPVVDPELPIKTSETETDIPAETQSAASPELQSTQAPQSGGTLPPNQPSAPVVNPVTSPVSNEPVLETPEPVSTEPVISKPVKPPKPEKPEKPEKPDRPGRNR